MEKNAETKKDAKLKDRAKVRKADGGDSQTKMLEDELAKEYVELKKTMRNAISSVSKKATALRQHKLDAREQAVVKREKKLVLRSQEVDRQETDLATKMRDKETEIEQLQWDLKKKQAEIDGLLEKLNSHNYGPTFTHFSRLPIEVRLKIWDLVETPYDEPRIHAIRGIPYHLLKGKPSYHSHVRNQKDPEHHQIYMTNDYWICDRVAFPSPHGVHPILHVCKEAREFFTAKFSLQWAFDTLVNFTLDTILLDKTPCLDDWEDLDLVGVSEVVNPFPRDYWVVFSLIERLRN